MNKFIKYKNHIIIGIFCGILNGLFGAGGGSLAVPAMEMFLGVDEKKSHATTIAVIFLMSIVGLVLYIKNGYFDKNLFIPASIGGLLGGFAGARLLAKISVKWLKIIFGVVVIITAVKMII